ncbi:MAG TPA: hypothetical protein PKE29_02345 [Phycisphaerales bacterium]|nr:hypothetical protein [Phycisphaerales bacterium]
MLTQSAAAAQDDWSRERTVRCGGQMGGSIAGSVGGWIDCVRGQGIGAPRQSLCLFALRILSHRFDVRVVSCHGLPLYPSADTADPSRGSPTEHLARFEAS